MAAAAAANDCWAATKDEAEGERENVVGGNDIDIGVLVDVVVGG